MEAIIQDLSIPKRQIRETRCPNRFQLLAHKSWLKLISQSGKVSSDFPLYSTEAFEWPRGGPSSAWSRVYVSVSNPIAELFFYLWGIWKLRGGWCRNIVSWGCDARPPSMRFSVMLLF